MLQYIANVFQFTSPTKKIKAEKQQSYGKLNFTGRWAYKREGLYPEGPITGIFFLFAG